MLLVTSWHRKAIHSPKQMMQQNLQLRTASPAATSSSHTHATKKNAKK